MTDRILFSNFAISTLASGITNVATTLNVAAGAGVKFSAPAAGQSVMATLYDTAGNKEVVKVTNRSTDQFTIVRAQEGTAARAWISGDGFIQVPTAAILDLVAQKRDADYLTAGGTGNAITLTPDPAITGYEATKKIRFRVTVANTAAVTVNVSAVGARGLKKLSGTDLSAGELFVGQIIEAYDNGTEYRITSGLQDRTNQYITAAGTDTYTAGLTPAATSLPAGWEVHVKFTNANTLASPTLNIDATGAKIIKTANGGVVGIGEILAGEEYMLRSDGTDLRIIGKAFSQISSLTAKAVPDLANDFAVLFDSLANRIYKYSLGAGAVNLTRMQVNNLSVVSTSVAIAQVTADELIVYSSGLPKKISYLATLCDVAVSGVSGRDTGSEAANTFYYLYAIAKAAPITDAAVTADAATDIITHTAHGLVANTPITVGGTAVPTGLSANTVYYLRDITTNSYKVASTIGGAAINFTTNGTAVTVSEKSALVWSTNSTAPTMPSGYTYSSRIGFARNDGSSNFLGFNQKDREYFYTTEQVIVAGSASAGVEQSVSLTSFVPPVVRKILAHWIVRITPSAANTTELRLTSGGGAFFSITMSGDSVAEIHDNAQFSMPYIATLYYFNSSAALNDAWINGVTL